MKIHLLNNRAARLIIWAISLCVLFAALAMPRAPATGQGPSTTDARLERGRYLVLIAGCNDCHTPGYAVSGGNVPEQGWLVGDSIGNSGPWGTTYPTNLRLRVAGMTEQQWLALAGGAKTRPPMPWPSLHAMQEEDLKAIYHYIAHLGPKGEPAPAYVPPGQAAKTPAVVFPAAQP